MRELNEIFLQWSSVVKPAVILLLFALTTLHAFVFTFIDTWL